MKSFKCEVIADNSGKWVGNMLRFATQREAEAYAIDLSCRWMAVRETRVVESDDAVTEVCVVKPPAVSPSVRLAAARAAYAAKAEDMTADTDFADELREVAEAEAAVEESVS